MIEAHARPNWPEHAGRPARGGAVSPSRRKPAIDPRRPAPVVDQCRSISETQAESRADRGDSFTQVDPPARDHSGLDCHVREPEENAPPKTGSLSFHQFNEASVPPRLRDAADRLGIIRGMPRGWGLPPTKKPRRSGAKFEIGTKVNATILARSLGILVAWLPQSPMKVRRRPIFARRWRHCTTRVTLIPAPAPLTRGAGGFPSKSDGHPLQPRPDG
jgi:hypothetical protein